MREEWLRIDLDVPAHDLDAASSVLRDHGAGAIEVQESPDRAKAIAYVRGVDLEELRGRLEARLRPAWTLAVAPFADESWREVWKRHLAPAAVSRRLAVAPPWDVPDFGPAFRTIRVDPGLAFGSGTHPTTRLALEWLDETLEARPIGSVLDVGCGTGVLAAAAAVLGAPGLRIAAVDLDPEALRVTGETLAANGVAGRVEVLDSIDRAEGAFDLVLANILATVLVELADPIAARLAPGGRLVLSGMLVGQDRAVEASYSARGLRRVERREEEGWVGLCLESVGWTR